MSETLGACLALRVLTWGVTPRTWSRAVRALRFADGCPLIAAAIIPVTPLQQNCTLLWCTKTMRGAFVDPGGDLPRLNATAQQAGVTIEKILLTQGTGFNWPDPDHLRIVTLPWSRDLAEAIQRMGNFLSTYRQD